MNKRKLRFHYNFVGEMLSSARRIVSGSKCLELGADSQLEDKGVSEYGEGWPGEKKVLPR